MNKRYLILRRPVPQEAQEGGKFGTYSTEDKGKADAAIAGSSMATSLGGKYLDERNSETDVFGNEVYDDTDATNEIGKGFFSGSNTGASLGSAIGPWGTLIGAAVGGIAGAISGGVKGKKKKKAYESAFSKNSQISHTRSTQEADKRQAQALLGKSGTKMGSFKLKKKKPQL